jgi:GNAT superfamily N-acetyltransferase
MRICVGWGCPPESAWPYGEQGRTWPPAEAPGIDAIAKKQRAAYYQRLRNSLDAQRALVNYLGVTLSVPITHQWFDSEDGKIAMPDDPSEFISDHCIALDGYADGHFKFANSWGTRWGDRGFGYLPFEYFNRYVIDSFALDPRPVIQLSKDKKEDLAGWCINSPLGLPLHGIELWDRRHDERQGWVFATERDGFLDVEELFVRPSYRKQGLGRSLLKQIRVHAEQRQLPLRFWVPHGDCVDETSRIMLSKFIGLPLLRSEVSWADFTASEIVLPSSAVITNRVRDT